MTALVAAAFVVNAYRRRYYGGLLVAPAIAVLFVMNIFPLLWSLGLFWPLASGDRLPARSTEDVELA